MNDPKITLKHNSVKDLKNCLLKESENHVLYPITLKERKLLIKLFELCGKYEKSKERKSSSKSLSDKTNLQQYLPKLQDYDCFTKIKEREKNKFSDKNYNFDHRSKDIKLSYKYRESKCMQLKLIKHYSPVKLDPKNANKWKVIGSYRNVTGDKLRNGGRCVMTSKSFSYSVYKLPDFITI